MSKCHSGTIRAIVFDLDGTVADTERLLFESWREAFEVYACQLTLEEWSPHVGTDSGFDPVELLCTRARLSPDARIDAAARVARGVKSRLARLEPRPGVAAWIDEARALGMKLAVASSSPDEWVMARLDDLGLAPRFDVISCRGGRLRAKPAPDVYLDACSRLDVPPAMAVAVEDSIHGLRAATSAGLRCIAVPNDITRHFDLSAASLEIASLDDCDLSEALSRLCAPPDQGVPPTPARGEPERA